MNGLLKNIHEAREKVEMLNEDKKIRQKRKTWGRSGLVKFRGELYLLRKAGASLSKLQYWLQQEKRIRVARSTILRFLGKQREGV